MSRRNKQSLPPRLLAAYLEGEVTASEAAHIERELREHASNRRCLAELEQIRGSLAAPAGELEQLDLVAAVRRAARERVAEAPRSRWLAFWPLGVPSVAERHRRRAGQRGARGGLLRARRGG